MLSTDDVTQIASEEGVPAKYVLAIMGQENSKQTAVSGKGAVGRMQLLPATFDEMMPDGDITDEKDNVRAGVRYLKQGLQASNGDFTKAAQYYYGGPAAQQKMQADPNKKYGGLSIEDYGKGATSKVDNASPQTTTTTSAPSSVDAFLAANTFPISDSPDSPPQSSKSSSASSGSVVLSDTDLANATPGIVPGPIVVTGQRPKVSDLNAQANARLEFAQAASDDLSITLKKNLQDSIDSISREGELNATIALDKYGQEAQKSQEAATELSRLGINTSDLDSTIASISSNMSDEFKRTQAMRAAIDQKRNVGLLDDPIEYIMNQFTLPRDIREHNAIINNMAAEKEYVAQATTIASTVQQVNAAKFTTVSAKGAQAAADLAREAAIQKAASLEDKLSTVDYDQQVRGLALINARIASIDQQQKMDETSDARKTVADLKAQQAERQQLDDQAVTTAGKVLGMSIPDRKTLDKMPKDSKAAVEYIMANDGVIGKDPMEALQVLQRGNQRNMPPAVAYQKDVLDTAFRDAQNVVMAKPEMKTASPKQLQEAVTLQMQASLNHMAVDPNFSIKPAVGGVVNNPYHIPDSSIMEKLPDLKTNRIPLILADYKKNFPNQPLTDSMIVDLAYQNIGKQYSDISAVSRDVSRYFQAGVDYNNTSMAFDKFGLPNEAAYKVGGADYTKPEQVMKLLLQKERDKQNIQFREPGFGMG